MQKRSHVRHASAGRRGYVLVEIMGALALTATVAAISSQLFVRILTTSREMSAAERESAVVDRAAERLRHDVERAARVSVNGAVLTLGPVTWATEPDALIRTEGTHVDRFEPMGQAPAFLLKGDVLTLRLADDEWTFAPLADREAPQ